MDQGEDLLNRRAAARVGQMLRGKWRLDALLGVGGMASVYAATHRVGQRGAVKILHAELSIDESARGRFLREGYVANRVRHRGAVAVVDDDTAEDGSVYLVMELLEGETLEQRAERLGGRLDADEVVYVASQVLEVLRAAHAAQIIHRDLKPDNLFLTNDGVVKVLDFGIARLRETSSSFTATRSGSTLGTPAFMSPEQARGHKDELDARSDLWSLGATMYSLLTGRLVHEAATVNMVLLAAMTKPAAPIRSIAPDVPEALAAFVDRALEFEASARFQSADDMLAALAPLGPGALRGEIGTSSRGAGSLATGPTEDFDPNKGPLASPRSPSGSRKMDLVTASPVSRDSIDVRGTLRSSRSRVFLIGALLGAAFALSGLLVLVLRPGSTGSASTTVAREPAVSAAAAPLVNDAVPPAVAPASASAVSAPAESSRADDSAAATSAAPEASSSVRSPPPARPAARPQAPRKPGSKNPLD